MDRRSSPAAFHRTSNQTESLVGPGEKTILDEATPLSAEQSMEEQQEDLRQQKITQIKRACEQEDITGLVELAKSRAGFVEDSLRRAAWPILLGCSERSDHNDVPDWNALPVHRDEEQVQLDVNRSFVYYPNNESEQRLGQRRQELSDLIVEVLRRHPLLCYFQGYHDIVQVLLLVLGREQSTEATIRLSLLRIRDFMLPAMAPAIPHLRLLPSILYLANRRLYQRVAPTQPFFALSSTLTMYAHDTQKYGDIVRLFDFLLAGEAVLPVYYYAAIILDREKELLEVPEDEPDMLHFTLSKLPQDLDIEGLIASTRDLLKRYPPERLPSWRGISSDSVLKTTREPAALARQGVEYGENAFRRQAKALSRQQALEHLYKTARLRLRMYRRPAMFAAAAVAVGALAWWLGGRSQYRHRFW